MKVTLIGSGTEKTHNATGVFKRIKPKYYSGNTCNDCGIPVQPRRRYCDSCRDQRRSSKHIVKGKLTAQNPHSKPKNGGQKMNKLEKGGDLNSASKCTYEPLYVPTTARNIWTDESLNLQRQRKDRR